MPARAIHLEMAHYRASTKSLVDSACSRRKALLQDPRHMKREQGDPTTKLSVSELFLEHVIPPAAVQICETRISDLQQSFEECICT
jgi:hypothetical protein